MNRSKEELQLVFDTVAMHMLEQCAKSMEGDEPRYHHADGRKCCIGYLIIDSVYRDIIEGKSIHSEFVRLALKQSGVNIENPNLFQLLVACQDAHDNYDVNAWAARLCEISSKYGLSDAQVLRAQLRDRVKSIC